MLSRILELYPPLAAELREKSAIVGVGVDTSAFRPIPLDERVDAIARVRPEPGGKTPAQTEELWAQLARGEWSAVNDYASAYDHTRPDDDIRRKLTGIPWDAGRIVFYVGALTAGKGLQNLLCALPTVIERHPECHVVIVGSGKYREILEALVYAIAVGDDDLYQYLAARGFDLDASELSGRWEGVEGPVPELPHMRDHVHFSRTPRTRESAPRVPVRRRLRVPVRCARGVPAGPDGKPGQWCLSHGQRFQWFRGRVLRARIVAGCRRRRKDAASLPRSGSGVRARASIDRGLRRGQPPRSSERAPDHRRRSLRLAHPRTRDDGRLRAVCPVSPLDIFWEYANGLWVVPAEGGEPRQVMPVGWTPDWSPDGEWISFSAGARDGGPQRVRPSGEDATPLPVSGGLHYRWSPDSKSVLYTADGDLWVASIENLQERRLSDLAGKRGSVLVWPPDTDGQNLYFTWRADLGDIWVMDVVTDESE